MGFESASYFEASQKRTLSTWKAVEYAVTFNQLFYYRHTSTVCGEVNMIPFTLLRITFQCTALESCIIAYFFFPLRGTQ